MWLLHVNTNTYYPYTDLLAKKIGLIPVSENPFPKKVESKIVASQEEETVVEEVVPTFVMKKEPVKKPVAKKTAIPPKLIKKRG
jgi:hypothetical protein